MIIFGFRSYLRALAVVTLVCRHCGNPAAHRVVELTRKFTLFFVPLFPVSRSRAMTCTYCGTSTKLTKEHADQLAAVPSAGAPAAVDPAVGDPSTPSL